MTDLRAQFGMGRQYGYKLADIKPNHVVRYKWAAGFVAGKNVVDAGCGVGYGSWILSEPARSVIGLEFDPGIVEFARKNWSRGENITYFPCELMTESESLVAEVEVCVALESIEHLLVPELFFANLPVGCHLVGSVPNQNTRPLETKKFSNPHHFQNYTHEQVEELMEKSGFGPVEEWLSQGLAELSPGKDDDKTILFRATKVRDVHVAPAGLVRRLTSEILKRNNRILDLKAGRQ